MPENNSLRIKGRIEGLSGSAGVVLHTSYWEPGADTAEALGQGGQQRVCIFIHPFNCETRQKSPRGRCAVSYCIKRKAAHMKMLSKRAH